MKNSRIEWTHHTFSPWRGCTKVSAGCTNCYAETMAKSNPAVLGEWGPNGTRVIASESYWLQPISWNKEAEAAGKRRRVFCAPLCDVFEGPDTMPSEVWPLVSAARRHLYHLIEKTPCLDWLLLTKRPANVNTLIPVRWSARLPDNVWIGTSVENQAAADERIPYLLRIPARVRFLSCEPLLGPVDINKAAWGEGGPQYPLDIQARMIDPRGIDASWSEGFTPARTIDWIIAGGESGPKARPMHPEWVRSLRDQAKAADVAFLFKQWGEWLGTYPTEPKPVHDAPCHEWNGGITAWRVGKKAAGRLLNGQLWDEYPG